MYRFALLGGNEFRDPCEQFDSAIISMCSSESPNVTIIPTAAANQNPYLAEKNGCNYFTKLGATPNSVSILTRKDSNNRDLTSQIESSEIIYLAGGDPKHLVDVMKESVFLETLLTQMRDGAIVAGSSAGAMAMGAMMHYRESIGALDIVNKIMTIPHHENKVPEIIYRESLNYIQMGITVIGLDSGTGIISDGATCKVYGDGQVVIYEIKGWQTYQSGEELTI